MHNQGEFLKRFGAIIYNAISGEFVFSAETCDSDISSHICQLRPGLFTYF